MNNSRKFKIQNGIRLASALEQNSIRNSIEFPPEKFDEIKVFLYKSKNFTMSPTS